MTPTTLDDADPDVGRNTERLVTLTVVSATDLLSRDRTMPVDYFLQAQVERARSEV